MRTEAIRHDAPTATATPAAGKRGERLRYVLGLDVDLNCCVTAIQAGHGPVRPAQKWTRAQLVKWVKEPVFAGHEVHTVYEACGFGYTLHGELTAAGAHNVVTTPTRLSPERRRKNDRRDALVRGAGRCVSHLHKALTQMNVQLHHVISDLTGVTGLAILEAILAGERDPQRLAALKDHRIKASRDTIAKSLQGDWRPEHLFTLKQTHALWQQHQPLIAE